MKWYANVYAMWISCMLSVLMPLAAMAQVPPPSPTSSPADASALPPASLPPAGVVSIPPSPTGVAAPATNPSANPTAADAAASAKPGAAVLNTMLPTVPAAPIKFSFGEASSSLLFTADQINAMKNALRTYESLQSIGSDNTPVTVNAPAPVIPEPAVYPVFYLTSIAYRNSKDWTVWVHEIASPSATPPVNDVMPGVNGDVTSAAKVSDPLLHRLTPKSNSGELQAVKVYPDRVEFSWQPTYIAAIQQRVEKKKFAAMDKVKHRIANINIVQFDNNAHLVRFMLKENQSFSSGYFSCFEGRINTVALDPINPPLPVAGAPGVAAPVAAGAADATGQPKIDIDALLAAQQAANKSTPNPVPVNNSGLNSPSTIGNH